LRTLARIVDVCGRQGGLAADTHEITDQIGRCGNAGLGGSSHRRDWPGGLQGDLDGLSIRAVPAPITYRATRRHTQALAPISRVFRDHPAKLGRSVSRTLSRDGSQCFWPRARDGHELANEPTSA
jgi:hypothetical protein